MAQPIAILTPTPMRRHLSTGVIFALAIVLFYSALWGEGAALPVRGIVALCGLGALALAARGQRAGLLGLELRDTGLFDSRGNLLAAAEDIKAVDRGTFSFKPSNGFVLHLARNHPPLWVPGLYWRYGKRLGVGGVTRAPEARAMADRIAVMLMDAAPAP